LREFYVSSFFYLILINNLMIIWLQTHYIELIGSIAGLIYLYLEIKQKIWLWPFGLVTSALYIYVFFVSKFYADMGLQFYYLFISIYGWWHWIYGGNKHSKGELPVSRLKFNVGIYLLAVSVIIFIALVFILKNYTDSPVPYGDSFTTALSIIATWMLARKILEMWWIWVVVNGVSLALYVYKGLYPTSVLFVFYTTMSFVGYMQWKRSMKPSDDENNQKLVNVD
jgi:nicotinamide mononucleotide transporter